MRPSPPRPAREPPPRPTDTRGMRHVPPTPAIPQVPERAGEGRGPPRRPERDRVGPGVGLTPCVLLLRDPAVCLAQATGVTDHTVSRTLRFYFLTTTTHRHRCAARAIVPCCAPLPTRDPRQLLISAAACGRREAAGAGGLRGKCTLHARGVQALLPASPDTRLRGCARRQATIRGPGCEGDRACFARLAGNEARRKSEPELRSPGFPLPGRRGRGAARSRPALSPDAGLRGGSVRTVQGPRPVHGGCPWGARPLTPCESRVHRGFPRRDKQHFTSVHVLLCVPSPPTAGGVGTPLSHDQGEGR